MNREQLQYRLDTTWAALGASFAGLSEEQMTAPGVVGDWSVKDILGHVSTWDEEALQALPVILDGRRPPRYVTYGGIDAFNAQMAERKRDLPLAELLKQLEETHRRLLAFVETVPEEQFARETRVRHRLRLDTYSHYPIHTKGIEEWRAGKAGAAR